MTGRHLPEGRRGGDAGLHGVLAALGEAAAGGRRPQVGRQPFDRFEPHPARLAGGLEEAHEIARGREELRGRPGIAGEGLEPGDLERIHRPIDWFGVNHYSPIYARANPNTPLRFDWADAPADVRRSQIGWQIDPQAFRDTLLDLHRRYRLPIYVTENGAGAQEKPDTSGEIIDEGRIVEVPGASTGGRPRSTIRFNPLAGCVIGVDLGGSRCHGILEASRRRTAKRG